MATLSASDWTLERDPMGALVMRLADGTRHAGVVPVRAFPVSDPGGGLSLVGPDGHELAWIESLERVPEAQRGLIEEELASREFVPEIRQILAVSTFATPSVWDVQTDRGATRLVLRGEEDIRRLPGGALMVADTHGVHFLIRQVSALDRPSRRLLERFL